jgi:hypothetical protein
VVACSAHADARLPGPVDASTPVVVSPVNANASPVVDAQTGDRRSSDEPGSSPSDCMSPRYPSYGRTVVTSDQRPPPAPDIEPKKWLIAHGAKGSVEDSARQQGYGDGGDCVELRVGPAHERALQCLEENDNSADGGYWAVFNQVVLLVRAGKIVKALDVPVSFTNGDSGYTAFKLDLRIADDGNSATLDSDRCYACPVGIAKHETRDSPPTVDDVILDMCAASGVYRWHDGRFRH